MNRIKLLDSMRGLAATIVVFHHVYTSFNSIFTANFSSLVLNIFAFISNLNVQAVLFFFFLSGFTICLSVWQNLPLTKNSFSKYIYRRLKRILPLYYIAIAFTFVCGWLANTILANEDFSIKNLLGNVFFLQCSKAYHGNWFTPYGNNGPLWSISFEMYYYWLMPLFLLCILAITKAKNFTSFTNCVALVAAFIISITCVLINYFFFFPFVAFTALFYVWYVGFFSAWLYINKKIKMDLNFILLVTLMLVLILIHCKAPSATIQKLIFGAAISVLFYLLFLLRRKISIGFTSIAEYFFNCIFYKIGTGSYALYLLHYPILLLLKYKGYNTSVCLGFTLIILIVCSIWLEKKVSKISFLFLKRHYIK